MSSTRIKCKYYYDFSFSFKLWNIQFPSELRTKNRGLNFGLKVQVKNPFKAVGCVKQGAPEEE